MASNHLVLMGLRLANPLWLQVAELLCHFLKLELADRRWRQVVELHVVANVPMEVKRAVPQPTVCHTCQDKYLGAEVNTGIGPDIWQAIYIYNLRPLLMMDWIVIKE